MNIARLITASTLALALMVGIFTSPAFAETSVEQNQKLEQELEVECTAGAYGQDSTCKAYGKQVGEQSQKVLGVFREDGSFVKIHKPVDTGLDSPTLAGVTGIVLTGSAAAYLKIKSRQA